jgi:hypothetical protein
VPATNAALVLALCDIYYVPFNELKYEQAFIDRYCQIDFTTLSIPGKLPRSGRIDSAPQPMNER